MKVTIGLPFFNNQSTLADAIRSVFAQTERDWELILLDDGSTDNSAAVAACVSDPRVRFLKGGENRGLAVRLNQIAAAANGRYLARLDGDDMMHPQRLARQIEILESQPGTDLVGTAMYSLDSADRPRGMRGLTPPDARPASVLRRALLLHATITGRAAWFRRNPYSERCHRSEDRELYLRTFRSLSYVQLPEPLYLCREEFSVRLDKYLASCREDRSLFLEYGPQLVGPARTAALWLMSVLKGEVYRVCTSLHAERFLVRRRNTPLTDQQSDAAMEALSRVQTTAVPGLQPADKFTCVAC